MDEDGDALGMLALGQAVLSTGGTWHLSAVKSYGIDFEMLPGVQRSADGEIRTECGGHTFVLPKKTLTEEKKAALGTFISWFEEHVLDWAESGAIVAYKPVNESAEFAALPQAQVVEPGTRFYAHTFIYTAICGNVINTYGFQPVYGQMTPEDWAQTVVSEITSTIEAQQ